MQKTITNRLKIVAIILLVLGINACSKDDMDISNLNETIFVRHKKANMPAYIHGNGSEKVFLIILHGGPGANGLLYRQNTIKSEIEKNNAVVYFDQRGSGNSQGNYSDDYVSVDIMAEDVLALAKVLRAKFGNDSKLFLMGHSWGGTLGTAVLLKNQSYFSGWIDLDGSHDPKGSYNKYKIALTETANEQIALGNSTDHWNSTLNVVQNVSSDFDLDDFYELNKETHKGERKLSEDKVINETKSDFGNDLPNNNPITFFWNTNRVRYILASQKGLYENVSFTDRLHQITIPSLVLWGKYDLVVPTVNAQEAFDNLGSNDKAIYIFNKSGHSPLESEPDLFADKVINFINRLK
jgi:pimeloyl-ACP methyl ester carboxylesterase